MEAKRNYERMHINNSRPHPVHQTSGHGVMAVSGRRPSTDAVFPRRDFYGKPSAAAVNLVIIVIKTLYTVTQALIKESVKL